MSVCGYGCGCACVHACVWVSFLWIRCFMFTSISLRKDLYTSVEHIISRFQVVTKSIYLYTLKKMQSVDLPDLT